MKQPYDNPDNSSEESGEKPDSRFSSIAWQPAFIEAIQMELHAYRDFLEFLPEYQLTAEPLRIDCLVIKKAKDVVIKKNIASMFREINLLEYKSPDDYVSVPDFYKVYAYACLYAALVKVPITNLTISFIESHYPKELLTHLQEARGYTVEKTYSGIYTVRGDILPIQVIDSRRLSQEENLWLKNLSNRLDPLAVIRLSNEVFRLDKAIRIKAYMETIAKANNYAFEEASKMDTTAKSLEEILVRTGFVAKMEAKIEAKMESKFEERKALNIAQKMINLGLPFETIVSATDLDPEKVKELYQ